MDRQIISEILESMHDEVMSQISANYAEFMRRKNPRINQATLIRDGLREFNEKWDNISGRMSLVPGKDFISILSARVQKECGKSITINQMISEMKLGELDPELREIINEIESFFDVSH